MDFVGALLINLLQIYIFILLARMLLSWFPNVDRSNSIVRVLYDITEPVLAPVRGIIPPMGGFDLSPILVFVAIRILQTFIGQML